MNQSRTQCPHCQKYFKVSVQAAGKTCVCKNCQNQFQIAIVDAGSEGTAAGVKPVAVAPIVAPAPAPPAKEAAVSPYEAFASNLMAEGGGDQSGSRSYANMSYVKTSGFQTDDDEAGMMGMASSEFVLRGLALVAFGAVVFLFAVAGLSFSRLPIVIPTGALIGTVAGLAGSCMVIAGLSSRKGAAFMLGGVPGLLFLGLGGLGCYWVINGDWSTTSSARRGRPSTSQMNQSFPNPSRVGDPGGWATGKSDPFGFPNRSEKERPSSRKGSRSRDPESVKPTPKSEALPKSETLPKSEAPKKPTPPKKSAAPAIPKKKPAPTESAPKVASERGPENESASESSSGDGSAQPVVIPFPKRETASVMRLMRAQGQFQSEMFTRGTRRAEDFPEEWISKFAGEESGSFIKCLANFDKKPMLGFEAMETMSQRKATQLGRIIPMFERTEFATSLAKEGYAVGGVNVHVVGGKILGLQCIFMKLADDSLDVDDTYDGPWVGSAPANENHSVRLVGDGRLVYGMMIEQASAVTALALIREAE